MNVGNIHQLTLGGNPTLSVTNVGVGQVFIVMLIQGTGGQAVNWFGTILWPSGTAPTLSTGAGKTDTFGFICTSAGNYLGFIIGQNA